MTSEVCTYSVDTLGRLVGEMGELMRWRGERHCRVRWEVGGELGVVEGLKRDGAQLPVLLRAE